MNAQVGSNIHISGHKRRKSASPHLPHGVGHSSCLWRWVWHVPPKRDGITGHECSSSSSSTVNVRTAPHDRSSHPVGNPGPSPAQGHGVFRQWGIQPATQAPDADRVISCVSEVHGSPCGIGSIKRLNILHGEGFTRASESSCGAAAAVSTVAEAWGAREAGGATWTPWHWPVSIWSNSVQLWDRAGAAVHDEIWCVNFKSKEASVPMKDHKHMLEKVSPKNLIFSCNTWKIKAPSVLHCTRREISSWNVDTALITASYTVIAGLC